jgi:hypothetical protein
MESVTVTSHAIQEIFGDLMNRDVLGTVHFQEKLVVVTMELITVSTHAPIHFRFGDLIIRNVILSAIIQEVLISFKMESVTVKSHAQLDSGGELMNKNVVPAMIQEQKEST